MTRYSIRLRLTIWYAGALAAVLVLFGFLVWISLERHLVSEVDEDLSGMADRFESYFLQESSERGSDQVAGELEEFCAALPPSSFVELRGSSGVVFRYPRQGHAPVAQRSVSRSFEYQGGRLDVTVGQSIHSLDHTMSVLRWQLFTLTPLAIAFACLGGWLLSGGAMKPVSGMARAAEAISIDNLAVRLEVPNTDDELQRFGEAFNRTLMRLEAAVNTLSQFVADASHELRTPLAVIRTSAEIALRRARSPEAYREALAGIAADTQRMTALVEDLLFLARSDAARSDAAAASQPAIPVDVNAIVRDAVQAVGHLAEAKSISIVTALEEPAFMPANRAALRRLFMALLDNAIKNSPDASEIRVSAKSLPDSFSVSVQDFGRGIDEDDLPHIFKRFYRADKSRTGDGYGLGLSIAESIARAHSATITVESRLGEGSTFTVRFGLPQRAYAFGRASTLQSPPAEVPETTANSAPGRRSLPS